MCTYTQAQGLFVAVFFTSLIIKILFIPQVLIGCHSMLGTKETAMTKDKKSGPRGAYLQQERSIKLSLGKCLT